MKRYRIGVIGLGQRIAHVLAAMQEVGWDFDLAAYVDPGPIGAPIPAQRAAPRLPAHRSEGGGAARGDRSPFCHAAPAGRGGHAVPDGHDG